jgi:hypothetical protein
LHMDDLASTARMGFPPSIISSARLPQ